MPNASELQREQESLSNGKNLIGILIWFEFRFTGRQIVIQRQLGNPNDPWWMLGGEIDILPNEPAPRAIKRKLKQDFGLEIDIWSISQDPIHQCLHSWCEGSLPATTDIFLVNVNDKELAIIYRVLTNRRCEVVAPHAVNVPRDEQYQPALRDCASKLFWRH